MTNATSVQVTVRILDKDYQVACPKEEERALLDAARYLDDKMKQIRDGGRIVGLERIAVMAALNLAHESLQKGQDLEGLEEARRRVQMLNEKLDLFLQLP